MSGLANLVWAMNTPRLKDDSTARYVLIFVCDHAGGKDHCWPRQSTLAERTGLSITTVGRALKTLEELRMIRRTARFGEDGGRLADMIEICNSDDAPASENTPTPPAQQQSKITSQSNLPSSDGAKRLSAVDVEFKFIRFWRGDGIDERTGYPRREGSNPKDPARKKFAAAVASGVDPDVIIAAADRLNDYHRRRNSFGTKYVPQAVTWLTQKRWETDDGEPTPGGRGHGGSGNGPSGGASFFDIASGNG